MTYAYCIYRHAHAAIRTTCSALYITRYARHVYRGVLYGGALYRGAYTRGAYAWVLMMTMDSCIGVAVVVGH